MSDEGVEWDFPDEAPQAPREEAWPDWQDWPGQGEPSERMAARLGEDRFARLEAVRASAGTGKTYALAIRYLRQLLAGVPPERILATTFTRKAAAEILERVLVRLARAALDPLQAAELAADLSEPELDQQAFQNHLRRLTANLHRVSISTIDAYFNRLASAFRFELNLPAELQLLDQDHPRVVRLRLAALRALLAGAEWDTLTDLIDRILHHRAQRGVSARLDEHFRSLNELFRQAPLEAWHQLPREPLPGPDEVLALAERLRELAARADKKSIRSALESAAELIVAGDWQSVIRKGLGDKILKKEDTFSRVPIPAEVVAAYEPVLSWARALALHGPREQLEALARLLEQFDAHFEAERLRTHVVLFSDLPLALARRISSLKPQEVALRLDSPIEHLLLDEFQDTSPEQWAVLRPLAQRVAASGGTLFCVGDTKQAIYGWRGGRAEIFEALSEDLPALQWETRARSFRSSSQVLEIVNRVFSSLDSNPAFRQEAHREAAARWQASYEPHEAARLLPGVVTLRVGLGSAASSREADFEPEDDDPESESTAPGQDPMDLFVAAEVQRLSIQHPGSSIGVLVRQNKRVRSLLFQLQRAGVSASGEGGNALTDDPAVEVVLDVLTLADHPGDTVACFRVLHSPLRQVVGLTSPASAGQTAESLRRQLLTRGYAASIAGWAKVLSPHCSARSARRLLQLVELADRHDQVRTLRPADFVTLARASQVEEPVSAPVRVMTIHKAKGLEFDVVVLTELEVAFVGRTPTVLEDRPHPLSPIRAIYPSGNSELRRLYPPLEHAYAQQQMREVQEGLCELYVAMTRARHALHIFVESSTGGRRGPTPAQVLLAVLGKDSPGEVGGGDVVLAGDPAWYAAHVGPTQPPQTAPVQLDTSAGPSTQVLQQGLTRCRLAPSDQARRGLGRIAPSGLERGATVLAHELLVPPDNPARSRGLQVHAWLEALTWLDDAGLDLEGIFRETSYQAPGLSIEQRSQLFQRLKQQLEAPEMRRLLSRPALQPGQQLELWRERSFAVRAEKTLLEGVFDRVVLVREGENPVRGQVLDFKTDEFEPAALERVVERYKTQLEAYRRALLSMTGLEAGKVSCHLLFVASGRVWSWT